MEEPAEDSGLRIQYDYMLAYFDFFTGAEEGYLKARRVARKYQDFPNMQWRMMFLQIKD